MTRKQKKVLWRIIAVFLLLVIVSFLPTDRLSESCILVLYLIPYLIIGYDILRKAVLGILHGEVFDENFLMAVATVGAMLLRDYREGVAVMLFYQIGELFQSVAVGKSRRNISALMDIRPDYANREAQDGTLIQADPEDVAVGSVILVRPGEKVPIDGIVVEGNSTLNTSALTGESLPREVTVGQEIISGCVNLSGVLRIRTTKEFGESTVSRILDLVENSSMKKAKAENFISKFAHYYTPAVCYSALALAVLPPVLNLVMGNSADFSNWVVRALTFLVISCPCALVISIPLSFFGGIGGASSQGILVKGANYLEALAKTRYVVFDKTGTLTKGVFQVTKVCPEKGVSQEQLLKYAAYAESFSNHPISKSLREAYGKEPDHTLISDTKEISGHGVITKVQDVEVAAGNRRLMEQLGITVDLPDISGTVVYVAVDDSYMGYLLIADVVKEQSESAVKALKKAGIRKTVMLTGDSKQVAEAVAKQLGVDEVRSELMPEDKVIQVELLLARKQKNEVLVFVGDGINDAPVLSRSDVGIAMGALGSDAAIEAADVVLMDDNPLKIAQAIGISRKCLRIVYENIVFALGVKGICLILGALGKAGMWLAIFADVGVMVIAVLNAIRCLKVDNVQNRNDF
ncbi:MAG: cadmium-translocating P-type ATPase [Lachnospiraceae bacterium]|nr:cadmium-translocating P-type ATPase [Lachnospiraceae bacterium]